MTVKITAQVGHLTIEVEEKDRIKAIATYDGLFAWAAHEVGK